MSLKHHQVPWALTTLVHQDSTQASLGRLSEESGPKSINKQATLAWDSRQ